ncbi:MAG: hypothetical protein ACI8QS_001572 [Planctomycetota bacterium]|jgi:hypothetical protein
MNRSASHLSLLSFIFCLAIGSGVSWGLAPAAIQVQDTPTAVESSVRIPTDLEEVLVDRDDFVLERSARVSFAPDVLGDAAGNGVLIIRGEDLIIDLSDAHLRGAAEDALPDTFRGTGIRIEGARISIHGARVSGFKVGIDARGVDGLVIEDSDVSGNFRQHLGSTAQREDSGDWLWPHDNDASEWIERYGAGIHIKDATGVSVRRCRARKGQNGLVLDRVVDSTVFDNDFSFLSGWGVAMWRSSRNVLCRNSLDFCVRGYSHGVYNRGQDSAGLLMFEQCSDNIVALNSITHGGDGIFGFAGKEALGQNPAPDGFDSNRKGNNRNLFLRNDLSYAAAHGYEMTFSFMNTVFGCRFIDNAICGVWAGYSQDSAFSRNLFRGNGAGAYGSERGGINIEHGKGNLIQFNRFIDDACGVRLWWDDDSSMANLPWIVANGSDCGSSALFGNNFIRSTVGLEIDGCPEIAVQGNTYQDCEADMKVSDDEAPRTELAIVKAPTPPPFPSYGGRQALGGRAEFPDRRFIIMTEWGPYDWESPLLVRGKDRDGAQVWRLLGTDGSSATFDLTSEGAVQVEGSLVQGEDGPEIHVRTSGSGVLAYSLSVPVGEEELTASELSFRTNWAVRVFESPDGLFKDINAWRAAAEDGVSFQVEALDFPMGGGALSAQPALADIAGLSAMPADYVGLVAESTFVLPAGNYVLKTRSDDGIRVIVDGQVKIEDWTHHGATPHDVELDFEAEGEHTVRVEWFELNGGAELIVGLEARGE